ncbi:MAG: sugar phosphate isomerase/epimerase [Treponema sp.]|jgi:sugar phosphate isomerase/epimerase|nr:sugar phosphate isomerase/epimerase [Treponema sp.]
MFKMSVITDEIDQDFETACALARKHSLDGVEIRSVYERGPFEFTGDDTRRMKKVLVKTGLRVCAISSPFFKCAMDKPAELREHLNGLRRCIAVADALDTDLIRGFSFWAGPDAAFDAGAIAARFGEAVKILEGTGKTLVLEADPSVQATNARTLAELVEAVASPLVRALWDPGNDIWDPRGELPFPDGYAVIKPVMAHMHLKDATKRNGKPEGTPVTKGDLDLEGQFRALIADGYSGYVSLETHYRPAHTLSEELLAMPKGAAFSRGGYEATDESLGLWKALLDRVI